LVTGLQLGRVGAQAIWHDASAQATTLSSAVLVLPIVVHTVGSAALPVKQSMQFVSALQSSSWEQQLVAMQSSHGPGMRISVQYGALPPLPVPGEELDAGVPVLVAVASPWLHAAQGSAPATTAESIVRACCLIRLSLG
jgi:hypothetical protein